MIPWWSAVIALIAGVLAGVVITGLCAANTVSEGRKWWEDE